MSKKKSLLAIFSLTIVMLTVGLVLYNTKTVDAKTTNEKVQQLLKDGYEYDLTKLLVVKKGSEKPEVVDLEDTSDDEVGVSSMALKVNDENLLKNQDRYEKLEKRLIELSNDKSIEHVQPVYIYTSHAWTREEILDSPDDFDLTTTPSSGNHWYYEKSNLRSVWYKQDCFNGGVGCGGYSDVVVAVIDTGLAYEDYISAWDGIQYTPAPDIVNIAESKSINLWTNTDEISNDGIDNDGNGFIDDIHGIHISNDIYCRTNACSDPQKSETVHPYDDTGHGTFVTGIISSLTDNAEGSVSAAHNVSIMTIKANDYKGLKKKFNTIQVSEAIEYAVENGADIINMSFGLSNVEDTLVENAINEAYLNNVLLVASSGNTHGLVEFPARLENVIAVGSLNANDTKVGNSAFGPELDLVAYVGSGRGPGVSTFQQSYFCYFAEDNTVCYSSDDPTRYANFRDWYAIGTSFAAPQVAAAAAIILGNNFGMTNDNLRLALSSTVNDVGEVGFDTYTGHGVIDFKKANDFSTGTEEVENLTVYRYIDGDGGWIWVGNPDLVNPVHIYLNIGGITKGTYSIDPQKTLPLSYPGLFDGPVKIVGSGPIHVSNKARAANGKLHESLAIPTADHNTRFYYPVYRYVNGDGAWLWIANPGTQTTANVQITLGGQNKGTHEILPGDTLALSYPGEFTGPLVVDSDINVYTTLKTRTGGGLDEFPGISQTDMSTSFYYPVYRYVNGDGAWLWLGNPSTSLVANVTIQVAGNEMGQYTIQPNSNLAVSYPGIFDGPVVINSDINIYSTLKSRTNDTINEFKGISTSEFSTSYYYPVYRYVNGDGAWLWIGNPDDVIVANITVKIAGNEVRQYTIEPNNNIAVSYEGVFDGPVSITSDIPVYSTMKSRSYGNLNEFVGAND